MFAYSAEDGPIGAITDAEPAGTFEAPDDLNFERMVAERERELGLPNAVSGAAQHAPVYTDPTPVYTPAYRAPVEPADLGSLPDKFTLSVEHKGSVWKITAPSVHTGLWKAGPDLNQVVNEALAALAEMVRIDGIVARGHRK